MFVLVDVLKKMVGSLSSSRSLLLKIGNSHVEHARKTNVLLEALASKAGNRSVKTYDLPTRYAGLENLLTDEYMINSTTVYNGRMEEMDLTPYQVGGAEFSVFPALIAKLRANGWMMYLSLHNPDDFANGFPVNGIWISGK